MLWQSEALLSRVRRDLEAFHLVFQHPDALLQLSILFSGLQDLRHTEASNLTASPQEHHPGVAT